MANRDKLTVGHRDFFECFGAWAGALIAVGGCSRRMPHPIPRTTSRAFIWSTGSRGTVIGGRR
jgi:hypothetical protein